MESTQLYVDSKNTFTSIYQTLIYIYLSKKCRQFGKGFSLEMAQNRLYWSDFHNFIFKFIPVYRSLVSHLSTIIIDSTCRATEEVGDLTTICDTQTQQSINA